MSAESRLPAIATALSLKRRMPLAMATFTIALAVACSGRSPPLQSTFRSPERPALEQWGSLAFAGDEIEHYEDLPAMTNESTTVVRATVNGIEPSRVFGEPGDYVQYVLAVLQVHEVLAGEGVSSGETLRLELGPVETSENIQERYGPLVGDTGVFFVRLKGEAIPPYVLPDPRERALGFYRIVSSQGGFLNDRGRVALAFWARDGFPSSYARFPFDEFVTRVRGYGN